MVRPKKSGYTALDGRQIDEEKLYESDIDEYSSRDVSGSQKPILRRRSSVSRKAVSFSYAMPRRRFSRYFTCALASALIIFILTLTRLKSLSETEIQLGLKKPPPPPPAWEEFPFLKRYHGGIRTLISRSLNKPEYPGAEHNALQATVVTKGQEKEVEQRGQSTVKRQASSSEPSYIPYSVYGQGSSANDYEPVVECYLDETKKTKVPMVQGHHGVPSGFPDPVMGSYDVLGLDNQTCFDRYGRLGPYGFGYSKKYGGSGAGIEGEGRDEAIQALWGDKLEMDYRSVRWAEAQERCAYKNRFRYKASAHARNNFFQTMAVGGPNDEAHLEGVYRSKDIVSREENVGKVQKEPLEHSMTDKKLLPRTAVIIRTWSEYKYDDEDLLFLRALVSDLSLGSGGEYTVHFLIHVKDDNMQIWSDDDTYQRVLNDALPEEFRGMGTLWSERQMGLIYGGVAETNYRGLPVNGAYRSTYMPVQYFAHRHPEYDFVWHWEMDIRYTGHYYHFFDRVSKWAAQQPRKGLWERNGRFYVPSEHGSWDDFKHMVRIQTEHGTSSRTNMYTKMGKDPKNPEEADDRPEKPIWGPLPPTGQGDRIETENDPVPPTTYAKDNYEWGVGEQADFITFNPLFDPDGTNWILNEDVTGYNTTAPNKFPPRRTAIITASRLSKRLLETMHRETALQRHTMFSEMWPGSACLHHGLKAVYAPHPVYIDRRWPTSYLAAIFNNGRNGASGGARTSVFSDERQHNFLGTTWYYHAGFSANLWKRWLGYKVDNDGGEEEEKAGEGRMCLPGMLLHPVKQVDLIYEHQVGG